MKKFFAAVLALVMMLSLVACGGGSSSSGGESSGGSEAITLKIQGAWAETDSNMRAVPDFCAKVAEKSGGTLNVEWGGGPEAIPQNQQTEALKNGIVDIVWTCHTYMSSHISVLAGMKLTIPSEMRTNGGQEFVDKLYQENLNGARYLGAVCDGLTYNLYSKEPVSSLEDFKGLTFRATPAYQAFVEALGAGAANMDPGDAYQALENNVIQGYGWPSVGVKDYAWQEVSKYIIEPAFYTTDTCILISGKAWSKLNETQQNALLEAAQEIEAEAKDYYAEAVAADHEALVAEGMEIIELPADVAEEYLNIANKAAWDLVVANDAENAKTLMGYTSYKG